MPSASDIKRIHALMDRTQKANKANIVSGITNGRTESVRDLTPAEVDEMIKALQNENKKKKDPADTMRKKIISIAWQMNWTEKKNGKLKANINRINEWCKKFGYLHKPLNDYKYKELPRLLTQFQAVYKDYLKRI